MTAIARHTVKYIEKMLLKDTEWQLDMQHIKARHTTINFIAQSQSHLGCCALPPPPPPRVRMNCEPSECQLDLRQKTWRRAAKGIANPADQSLPWGAEKTTEGSITWQFTGDLTGSSPALLLDARTHARTHISSSSSFWATREGKIKCSSYICRLPSLSSCSEPHLPLYLCTRGPSPSGRRFSSDKE